jgi:hypothetical protein
LGILGFSFSFFFEKKEGNKKNKKRRGNRGGWSHPLPKSGWPDHPIFGQGVASATPYQPYGGGFGLWGWSGHPKKKRREKWVLAFGGGRTTP